MAHRVVMISERPPATDGRPLTRVLIADDSAAMRGLLVWYLPATLGLEVVAEASDGIEVLAAVGRTRPDLLLMDVRMPNMDGLEATRQLRARGESLPILLLTGHAEAVPEGMVAEVGANQLIDKSSLGDRLAPAIEALVQGGGRVRQCD
jgi:CheY-like chemotaxis protein